MSVWAGNNDALGPAESGDTTGMTSVPTFTTALDAVVAAVRTAAPLDAILIGVVDPLDFAPIVQPAPALYLARQANLIAKPVSASCAPGVGDSLLVSLSPLGDPGLSAIDCAGGRYVLTPAEQRAVHRRVDAFNALTEARAAAGGWLYVDPNMIFAPELADPDAIRKCQGLAAARTPAELQAAALATCPGPTAPPTSTTGRRSSFFGRLISFDGVHPSADFHRAFANELARQLNERHPGLGLPTD